MKQVLRFLALAVLLAAPWGGYFNQVQAQQSLPYSYGFEDNNLATDGWTTSNTSGLNDSEFGISSYASTGSHGFCFSSYDDEGENTQYLISPELSAATGVVVQFYYRASDDYGYETFKVGYSTTDASPSSFTFGSEISTNNTSWTLSEEFNFPAGTKYVAIYYYSDYQYRLYVDDITFTAPASCAKPTGLAATLTPCSGTIATLNWTAGGTETNWTIDYSTTADFSSNVTSTTATGTPTKDLTGLTAETQYYARVKADCGGDYSEWSTTVTFTPTNAYTITVNDGTTTNNYVPFYGLYADSYSHSQFIIPASALTSIQYGTIDKLTFYSSTASATWSDANYEIYFAELDHNVFASAAFEDWSAMDLVYSGSVSVAGNEMELTLTNPYQYMGGDLLIGFKETATSSNYPSASWYGKSQIGNTAVYQYNSESITTQQFLPKTTFSFTPGAAPTCPKPTGLTLGAITATEAPLTWTAGGSETSWKVYLNGALVATVNTNSYNFTGLTANTDYTFGVAAVCDVDDESTIATVAGHTPCGTYAIPYSYGFEDLNDMDCWTVIDNPAHTTIDDGSIISASARTGDNFFVFTYYDYPDVDPQYMTLISPELTGIANGLHVEFYYHTDGENSYPETFKVGYSTTNTDLSSFTWVNTVTDVVAADYQLFKANYPANTKYVAVQHLSDDMDYLVIDDFSFTEAPDCREPSSIIASNITTTSANLSWTAGGAETAWDIYITNDNSVVPNDGTTPTYNDVASNTNYPISGLSSATTYYVYVRSACDETTNSDWTMPASFNTECEAISLPYQYDFEDDALPVCWNTIGTSSGWITSSISTTSPQQGSKHFVIQTSNYATGTQYVVLPEVDANYSLDEYEITFYSKLAGYSSTGRTLAVGVMTDPTDASTFVQVGDAFTPTTSYERYKIRLNTYTGSGQYIAIKQVITTASYSPDYTYIDNLEVNHIPACFEPTAFANTAVTAHGATFSWTAGNSETAWQIYVSTSASDPADDIADNASGMYAVTTNPYTIASGLDAETHYYAWVRANCGGVNGKSVWVGPVDFTTTIACPAPAGLAVGSITNHTAQVSWTNSGTDNYNVRYRTSANITGGTPETFGSFPPTDWLRLTGSVDEAVAGTAPTSSSSGWRSTTYAFGNSNATLNIYGTSVKYWLVTPEINLTADQGLSFDLALTDYGNSDVIETPTAQADDRFAVVIYADDAWSILREWNNSGSSYVYNSIATTGQKVFIDLSTYAGKTVKIAFYGESTVGSNGDNDIHIDNVNIGTVVPAGTWQNTSVTTNSAALSGLDAETQYDVQVQDVCGGIDGESTWSATTFTTDIPCATPTALAYSELKSNQVDLTWTETGTATDWIVAYKADADADFTEVAADAALIEGSNITFTLTGLTEETHYTVKVSANCEADLPGDGTSEFSSTVDFTTLEACAQPTAVAASNITNNSATISWTGDAEFTLRYRVAANYDGVEEDFTTAVPPAGWTRLTGSVDAAVAGTAPTTISSGWRSTTYAFGNKNATLNIYGSSVKNWLVTPAFTLAAGSAMSFDLALTDYNNSDAIEDNTAQSDDRFAVLVYADGDWTILREWNNSGSPYVFNDIATDGEPVNDIDISAYEGKNVKFAFYGESTVNNNGDNDLHIDNLTIGVPVAAGSWVEEDVSTATSHNVTGLTAETKYEVQVKALCGTNPVSDPYFFTTLYGFSKDIAANSWYAIASPVHNSGNNETVAGVDNLIATSPVEYDFLRYVQSEAKWQSYKEHTGDFNLERGRGYIYRRSAATTLKFIGERNTGTVTYNCSATYSMYDMKGWNLIGNPYPHEITRAHISQANDYLVSGYYTLQTNGSWLAVASTTAPIAVGQAILVKVTSSGNVTFSETAPATKAAPASTIAFTVSNDEFTDIAYARFSSEEGLPKIGHLNPEAPMLSIDGYAIANLNEGIESFPMSFSGQGSYTLTVSGNTDVTGYLHLVDRLTGRDIDLLSTPSYSFTGSPVSDRFTVKLTPDANEGSSTSRFAIFDGNSLIVNGEGTLEVYDVMGRRLMSAEVTGSEYRIPGSDLHTGVYVLRMNGNSQKIVIK